MKCTTSGTWSEERAWLGTSVLVKETPRPNTQSIRLSRLMLGSVSAEGSPDTSWDVTYAAVQGHPEPPPDPGCLCVCQAAILVTSVRARSSASMRRQMWLASLRLRQRIASFRVLPCSILRSK